MKLKVITRIITLAFVIALLWTISCFAEGSVDLTRNGGYRPYLEWDQALKTAGISRTNTLNVYAQKGETISLGSSVLASGDNKDIVLRTPSGEEIIYDVTNKIGLIDTREKELAGPNPDNGGYVPFVYQVDETGIYEVEFHSYYPTVNANTSTQLNPVATLVDTVFTTENSGKNQAAGVAAWDITVKSAGGQAVSGRTFSYYMALNTGNRNNAPLKKTPMDSNIFVLTKDGYLYDVDLNGCDPYGFILFANNKGLIDATSNTPLYGVGVSANNNLNLYGNVQVQKPSKVDTETEITHYIFLNEPAQDLPASIITSPRPAASITDFSAEDFIVGEGSNFHVTVDKATSCEIIIDVNQDGEFNPDNGDIRLADALRAGNNTISWDGKDKNGNDVAVGTYDARISTKAGEYHFPMLDVEYNKNGIKVQLINYTSAKDGFNPNTIYYDLSDYTSANGTKVTTNSNKGSRPISALGGVDSSQGALAFDNMYGDYKALDFWTYVDGMEVNTNLTVKDKIPNPTPTPTPTPIELDNNYAYIFGRTDTLMEAHDGMHRGEAAAVLYRLLKQNDKLGDFTYDPSAEASFSNLYGRWDRSAVEYMTFIGVYTANPNGVMSLDATITRGEAFKLFALALHYTQDTNLAYEEYAQILVQKGFVQGFEDGSLQLDREITRAQYCKIYNMIIGRDKCGLAMADGTLVTPETYGFTDIEQDWSYEIMLKATSAYNEQGFVDLELRGKRNVLDDYA